MQPSRRSQRVQPSAKQNHWSVSIIGILLVIISILMCYLILTTVRQSVKLTTIQSKLNQIELPISSDAPRAVQPQEQQTSSSTSLVNQGTMTTTPSQQSNEPVKQPETNTGVYVVKAGDTLSSIADQLGTSVDGLMSQNGLSSNVLQIGQELSH